MDLFTFKEIPFWWLSTDFGLLVFVLFFLTWGLVIVNLMLTILLLVFLCENFLEKGNNKEMGTGTTTS